MSDRGIRGRDNADFNKRLGLTTRGDLRSVSGAELQITRKGDFRETLKEGGLSGALVPDDY